MRGTDVSRPAPACFTPHRLTAGSTAPLFLAAGINFERKNENNVNEDGTRWHFFTVGTRRCMEMSRGRGTSPGQLRLVLIIMEMCESLRGQKNKQNKIRKSRVICSAHVRHMKQHGPLVGERDVEVQ